MYQQDRETLTTMMINKIKVNVFYLITDRCSTICIYRNGRSGGLFWSCEKEVLDVFLSREINPLWEENTLMLSKKKSREKEVLDVFLSREINPLWAPPLLGMVYENLLALFGLY